jgi:hypothetical protein
MHMEAFKQAAPPPTACAACCVLLRAACQRAVCCVLVCWCAGVVYRYAGVLVCWCAGVLRCAGVLVCWCVQVERCAHPHPVCGVLIVGVGSGDLVCMYFSTPECPSLSTNAQFELLRHPSAVTTSSKLQQGNPESRQEPSKWSSYKETITVRSSTKVAPPLIGGLVKNLPKPLRQLFDAVVQHAGDTD